MIHDVVVLGATVAGLTAARVLAREGFDVVVLDPNLEHRSAAIGHGVAAAGHASTISNMRSAYGEAVAVEHIVRNLRGTEFIRSVLDESDVDGRELMFVDRSRGHTTAGDLQDLVRLYSKAGAEVGVAADALTSRALVVDPMDYAVALRAQAVEAGANVVHGVTVTHVRRKEGATGIAFRNNLAWAREPGAVAAVACLDTLGVTPWGRHVRVGPAQWIPTMTARLAEPTDYVELRSHGQAWLLRPDDGHHLVVGQKATLVKIDEAREELAAELESQGAEVLASGKLAIDPSDHGRPLVGASAIPGGYYARGNGRGELMNGTASGLWLAETLVGQRDEGFALPLNRRMRAGIRSWVLSHRR
ncbi:FAD-dependent oxidoreductase [Tessaracoccus oleiagri]|uniref:Glycine/D-amino acid oxidase n=1 Tax=Tessaracoccus oleiagri TaxID=686624 RepID=A0A1G9JYJ1_9ACTN|nr:FAD-dependent oxidoreductase [Tessaracoccus oleiagri]SDL42296.1 Glycine/D-amino acid oxidase [Tessaracoccus oleiagri]